jgi:hypothetical protein
MAKRKRFVLCINPGSYRVSLEPRKVYRVLDDPEAEAHSLLRVIDETGEDYLFPKAYFVPIEVPAKAAPVFASPVSTQR